MPPDAKPSADTRRSLLRLVLAVAGTVAFVCAAVGLSHWWPGQPGDYVALVQQKLAPMPGVPAAEGKQLDAADRAVLRGNALLAQRKPEEAMRAFELAVAEQPAHALAWLNLGVAYYQVGRTNDTYDAWTRAYRLDKYNVMIPYNLGLMLELRGQLNAARDLYQQAGRLDPGNAEVRRALQRLQALGR
ncbi:MAG: tetratricopeptide repeat protein [Verrucomicrobia bacterium]|nr:tetratricopeptide repeat protein [Verrucomicrobiota bacterium]